MPLVIDASIAAAWCLPDEASDSADSVLAGLREDQAVVPSIWPLEIINALLIAERRERISTPAFARSIEFLSTLPITIDIDGLSSAFVTVPVLSRDHKLSSYDAAYLDVAMRLGLPLATLDQSLARAAGAVGVPLLT